MRLHTGGSRREARTPLQLNASHAGGSIRHSPPAAPQAGGGPGRDGWRQAPRLGGESDPCDNAHLIGYISPLQPAGHRPSHRLFAPLQPAGHRPPHHLLAPLQPAGHGHGSSPANASPVHHTNALSSTALRRTRRHCREIRKENCIAMRRRNAFISLITPSSSRICMRSVHNGYQGGRNVFTYILSGLAASWLAGGGRRKGDHGIPGARAD
jgi:hypothetical protein